jgi:zinc transporter ZupT
VHDSHDSHDEHDHSAEEHADTHDDYADHEQTGMSLTSFKIILTVFMFLIVYLGLIPKKVNWCTKTQLPLSFLNCFASGIFLAMAIVHILPETVEIWDAYLKQNNIERGFPLPYVGYLVGYILILLVDKVIAGKYHIHADDHDNVANN